MYGVVDIINVKLIIFFLLLLVSMQYHFPCFFLEISIFTLLRGWQDLGISFSLPLLYATFYFNILSIVWLLIDIVKNKQDSEILQAL